MGSKSWDSDKRLKASRESRHLGVLDYYYYAAAGKGRAEVGDDGPRILGFIGAGAAATATALVATASPGQKPRADKIYERGPENFMCDWRVAASFTTYEAPLKSWESRYWSRGSGPVARRGEYGLYYYLSFGDDRFLARDLREFG
jgi:hypothetical protein